LEVIRHKDLEIILLFLLFGIVFGLWIRACVSGSQLFNKALGEAGLVKQIENQMKYFDQFWGLIFGKPDNYSIYRPELDPYIRKAKSDLKQAFAGIICIAICLVVSSAL